MAIDIKGNIDNIKIENIEIFGWKPAIRGMKAKGYRKTKNNKYDEYMKYKNLNIRYSDD